MDLKTFISETLTQIIGGVADAKARVAEMDVGAAINPELVAGEREHAAASEVEFDVAVTVANNAREQEVHRAEGAAGGVLAVVGLKVAAHLGGEAVQERREEAISRVKFKVKIGQPADVRRRETRPNRLAGTY